ncbi:MAG: PKD domain-containing protein [Bacteroidetes bacterium]|nr:PKD domain-containing protein [Bacteroidota bacterium]
MKIRSILRYLIYIGLLALPASKGVAQCSADFQSDSTGCLGKGISFQAVNTGNGLNYRWIFGDPLSGTDNEDSTANPVHVFSASGFFQVQLAVSDSLGCTDTVIKTIQIFKNPIADFNYSNGCAGLQTQFTENNVTDSSDNIVQRFWDFGNATTGTNQNPKVNYGSTGNYTVQFILTSSAGCKDTVIKSVQIHKKPIPTADLQAACKNGSINFTADTSYAALTFNWDFGDSSYFTQRSVSHIYKNSGVYYPILTLDFGNTKCAVILDSIRIHPPPDPSFDIPSDTQCFTGNNVCVQITNTNQKIKYRSVFFDDGYVDDFTPLNNYNICHSYSDIFGGIYSITVELIDSNNCTATLTKSKAVLIHPRIESKFTFTTSGGCFKTKIFITNTSNQSPPKVNLFRWDFGDGNSNNSTWNNLTYTYQTDGSFNVKLWIQNSDGCVDSFIATQPVKNTNYTVDAHLDSSRGICKSNNYFIFKQTPISGATINWNLGLGLPRNTFTTTMTYNQVGKYIPVVLISKNGCDSFLQLDSIIVHGPQAVASGFTNRFQCQIKDSVYVQNSSLLFRNKGANVRWDAGDGYGPQCTQISKLTQNVGMNCRYSLDSFKFHHMYQKGKEQCYYLKLVVEDTIIGCSDSITYPIPLMAPQAKGLFFPSDTSPCPGPEIYKTLSFNYNIPQPTCLKYAYWVMWDSLAARKSGNFDSGWMYNSNSNTYPYEPYAGDSNGNVTIGLIVENGYDTLGKVCRDTGWFHEIIHVPHMSPLFSSSYDSSKYYCKNSTFYFFLKDSNQTAGTQYQWSFGDGSTLVTTDSSYKKHTYNKSGSYYVHLTVVNPKGCVGDTALWISVGVDKNFTISNNTKCVNDTFVIQENNRYNSRWGYSYPYWSDASRAAAGKELVWYDLGDGNGFQNIGPNPVLSYNYPGNYKISMAIKDSAGCRDTLSNLYVVNVSGVYAGFTFPKDSVLCPQSVKFTATATTVDSSVMKGMAGDYIKYYDWSFGNNYPKSQVRNPQRYFATGDYQIQLKVTNSFGCTDSITKNLVVIGPESKFSILSDTIGCEPLRIEFKNESLFATEWIWQFGDKLNSSFGTKMDTNVVFYYKGFGTFYPHLIARGSFTQNGVTRVCDAIYPDTSVAVNKSVTVWELPKPDFIWSTNCATGTTSFKNITTMQSGSITNYFWAFGDGSFSDSINPVHAYADTGNYRIVLRITSDHGCEDSIVRNIMVSPAPIPWFGYSDACFGNANTFKDSSFAFNDRIYLWRWEFGDGSISNQKNPNHIFPKDTTYTVKLRVTNVAGCSDSTTRNVLVFSKPITNFTLKNVCANQTASMENTTTGKQSISNYLWRFGDGNTSALTNPSHVYNPSGNYNIRLIATTVKGCMDSTQKTIQIYPNPVAKIHINNPDQCFTNHRFIFSDSSTISSGTVFAKWFFDVGDTADTAVVEYIYANVGTYGVRLYSVSNFGCRDTISDTVNVMYEPQAKYQLDVIEHCESTNLFQFTDKGFINEGSYEILWEFGDGDTASAAYTQHHYADSGSYLFRQILSSNKGCRDTAEEWIAVYPMPKPAFAINDSLQCLKGNSFIFSNNTTIVYGTLNYNWKFGDGQNSTTTSPTHIYNNFGLNTVALHATSNKGCIDSIKKALEVYPDPKAGFTVNDSTQCLRGNGFNWNNTSSIANGIITHSWTMGDGNSASSTNATHSYATEGNYSVKLVVVSSNTCMDSITKPMEVYPMPQMKLLVNAMNSCINNQNFIFTDSSNIVSGSLIRKWKFGDSTTDNNAVVSKTFLYPKNYKVWLTEISDKNCSDSASVTIRVFAKPYPSFGINDSTQCFRQNQFTFTSYTTIDSGALIYNWNYGDGNYGTGSSVNHSYSTPGTYTVKLKPISTNGCTDSTGINIEVYPMPASIFGMNDSTQCLRQNRFDFNNNSIISSGVMQYAWDFGDSNSSALQTPSHSYLKHGQFKVQLIATSDFYCADTSSHLVDVYPMPVTGFSVNDSDQCFNRQNFIFTDNSYIANGNLIRNWSSDDNSNAGVSPWLHNFNTDTFHIVKLVQTSAFGCMDSLSKKVEVFSAPTVSFAANDSDQCLQQNFYVFTNTSKIRKDTMAFVWNFGDNKYDIQTNPSHRYTNPGTYFIQLSALSENGCTDTIIKSIIVHPMPQVAFIINDTGQCVNAQNFIFTNNSNITSGNLFHLWNFGDGNIDGNQNVTHNYILDSSYVVKLIETSDKGCMDSVYHTLTVYPKPSILFSLDDSIQCLRQNQFNSNNTSKIKYGLLVYLWSMGDGNSATTNNISYAYGLHGNYNIGLKATSDLGCTDSAEIPVIVGAMPVPNFTINDPSQCFNDQNFIFTTTTTLASGTFQTQWNFGDNQISNQNNTTHLYSNFGNYLVRNISTTNYGCMDSLDKSLRVFANASASFITNDSDQCQNQQNYIFTNTSKIAAGKIQSIFWDLGNGNFDNKNVTGSFYPNAGSYKIKLTTTSDSGCTDSFSNLIRVYPKPAGWFDYNDSAQCLFQNNYIFTDNSFDSFGVNQYYWDINSENIQTTKTANYVFKSAGYKTITLIASSLRGCMDTSTRLVYVKPMPDPTFEKLDKFYCQNTGPYLFQPLTAGGNYFGHNISDPNYIPQILWDDTVKYIVTVNGCTDSSTQLTKVYPGPVADIGNDTALCKQEFLFLKLNSFSSKYIWSTGNNSPEIRITQPGRYWVTVSNMCGTKSDTIDVQFRDINCRFFLPTAFTPNRDNINDRYKPVVFNLDKMEYLIYNRWGELVYKGDLQSPGWDGTYMNANAQDGVYIIYVNYTYSNGPFNHEQQTASGSFTLVR